MIHLLLSVLISTSYVVDVSDAPMLDKKGSVVEPVIIHVQEFNEESATQFARDFQSALDTKQPIIPIVISSYGGSVMALLEMIDVIKASPVPVATIAVGKAMSCGAILLAMGNDGLRFSAPNATILLHDVSSMTQGKVSDIINDTNETIRLNNLLFTILAKQSHKPDNYFLNLLDAKGHIDLFLTPQQAKEYGIVNFIHNPILKVRVKTEMVLE